MNINVYTELQIDQMLDKIHVAIQLVGVAAFFFHPQSVPYYTPCIN